MAKLTLTIDTIMYHGLEQYIESLEGVSKVLITNKTNLIITITYDDSKIDINTLKLEILLYLNLSKTPSIIGFNKYKKGNYKEYKTSINDFCCEYCLKNMLEILLSNPNISAVTTNYNTETCNTKKLNMTITYNLDNTNSQEILKLINNILD